MRRDTYLDLALGALDRLGPAIGGALPALAAGAGAGLVVALLVVLPGLRGRSAAEGGRAAPGTEGCDFVIDGTRLGALSAPARALIARIDPEAQAPIRALREHLAQDHPGIAADLEALILHGTGFRTLSPATADGVREIRGWAEGTRVRLSIRPAAEDALLLQETRRALADARAEAAALAALFDALPVPIWQTGPDNQIVLANAAYRLLLPGADPEAPDHRIPDAFAAPDLDAGPVRNPTGDAWRRLGFRGPDGAETWFDLAAAAGADGTTAAIALPADAAVQAEATLRRFLATLTETFAHLPIGMAIFDRDRRLGMFNPALAELMDIDAAWLAGRPSLRAFLERLRERRRLPELPDFAAFRQLWTALEDRATAGGYQETWALASGQVLRVVGRPHPHGAIAYLFQDITPEITMERRFRREIEQGQAVIDRLDAPIAVFDAGGTLTYANPAFDSLWGTDSMGGLDGARADQLVAHWAAKTEPGPDWARIRAAFKPCEGREALSSPVTTRDGQSLCLKLTPLPDGSMLASFQPDESARRSGAPQAADAPGKPAPGSAPDAQAAPEPPAPRAARTPPESPLALAPPDLALIGEAAAWDGFARDLVDSGTNPSAEGASDAAMPPGLATLAARLPAPGIAPGTGCSVARDLAALLAPRQIAVRIADGDGLLDDPSLGLLALGASLALAAETPRGDTIRVTTRTEGDGASVTVSRMGAKPAARSVAPDAPWTGPAATGASGSAATAPEQTAADSATPGPATGGRRPGLARRLVARLVAGQGAAIRLLTGADGALVAVAVAVAARPGRTGQPARGADDGPAAPATGDGTETRTDAMHQSAAAPAPPEATGPPAADGRAPARPPLRATGAAP